MGQSMGESFITERFQKRFPERFLKGDHPLSPFRELSRLSSGPSHGKDLEVAVTFASISEVYVNPGSRQPGQTTTTQH